MNPAVPSPAIRRALISVSDKTGLVEFARGLAAAGVAIYSTGGTRKALEEAGLVVEDVSDYTGFPEMMDGRLKTLHPKIHGGILCRHDRPDDMEAMQKHDIVAFELVVVNLYPFEATVARSGVTFDEAIEQIDIGGPSLLRGAAKNHAFTTIATDTSQYPTILEQIRSAGSTTIELRRQLAAAAFALTARYDQAIARYFQRQLGRDEFPQSIGLQLERKEILRYGENPHQRAAVYAQQGLAGSRLIAARQLNGKELSYNNLLDLHSALAIVRNLPAAAVSVIKHNNPCGAAMAARLADATRAALDGDAVSAFGSVLGFNRPVDAAAAEVLVEPGRFVEAIVAPSFEPAALEILTTRPKWKDNVRLMELGALEKSAASLEYRAIDGGFLVQDADLLPDDASQWKVATEKQPSDALLAELRFAWEMVRHVKSNAIVLCRQQSLVGVGAGQMSRVDSVEIAIRKAGERAPGSVLASDAFFPFADSIPLAAAAGVAAIIQPGGSRRDEEVVAACNQHGIPMLFTGRRHFKH
jgi:phosphoribosylaminoimidazolecarboxamide formyltransferase/IMP cyclohydrolase